MSVYSYIRLAAEIMGLQTHCSELHGQGTSNTCCENEDEAQLSTALLPDATNDVLKHVLHTLLIQAGGGSHLCS